MRKVEELSDPNSCLNRANDNEHLFVLRASDPAAAFTIRAWAAERVRLGLNKCSDAKITSALGLSIVIDLTHPPVGKG